MALSLEIRNLTKRYGTEQGEAVTVFEDFDLRVERGEFVALVGPSGCGKTTLLRIVAGLERATSGKILLERRIITRPDRHVGLVFQEYALFPWRTTLQNIVLGLEITGVPKSERHRRAMEYIEAFGLAGFEHRYPKELSGGMKQRVAIARTLIMDPRVVLMDEPFGSLDSQTRNELQHFLLQVWEARRDTILFVTHNVDEAVYLSDRVVVLSRRPAEIVETFPVPLPRPRDRTGREANEIRKRILDVLGAAGSSRETASPSETFSP